MTKFVLYYLEANIILGVSAILIGALVFCSGKFHGVIRKKDIHRLCTLLSMSALVYLIAAPSLPKQELFRPSVKIWSAASINSIEKLDIERSSESSSPSLSPDTSQTHLSFTNINFLIFTFIMLGLLIGLIRLAIGFHFINGIIKRSFLIRKIGQVEIFATNEIGVPCSSWFFGRNLVLMPSTLVGENEKFRLAITHELQHHRQGDTRFIYVFYALKYLFFFNPASHFIERGLEKIQEFACDETLIDHHKVSPLAYCRCLVEVAESSKRTSRQPIGAIGMATSSSYSTLKRRIHSMLNQNHHKKRKSLSFVFGAVSLSLLTATTYASRGSIQDKHIDMKTAQRLVDTHQEETNFPIELNKQVLEQLNRYAGTAEGREHMRQAMKRMEKYREMMSKKFEDYGHPQDLFAVAIVESGFRNYLPNKDSMQAAGIWQFIPKTARHYGLKVNTRIDERLDVFLATDAAMRLLQNLNSRFQDWKLALLAYNAGSKKVQEGIDTTNSRNAWDLIDAGYEGDRGYLSKVIATAILLRNPEFIN